MMNKPVFTCLLIYFAFNAANCLKAQTPVVSFLAANGGSVQEGVGGVNTAVTITNPNSNQTAVVLLHSGTATYGVDYTIHPDTIIFPAGSAASQPLTINLPNDCVDESNETIILMLSNPTNGAQIGIGTITITLLDDDTQPVESCSYAIPSNIGVVTNTFSYFSHNGKFWVCGTGTLRLRSNNSIALVESGGEGIAEQDRNVIYVKAGGTATVKGGDQNVIYAEDGAIVTVESGNCNAVFASPGATFTDSGTGTVLSTLTCAPLNIDYSQAPIPGCVISATHEIVREDKIEIYPNPTTGRFEIRHADEQVLQSIKVYTSQGVFLNSLSTQDMKISVPPGVYFLRCVFNNEVYIRRLVISND